MAASTVPAAKSAILTLLAAIPDLNEVVIDWGQPTETEDLAQGELIFFDGPTVRLPEWGSLGGAPIDETYTLTLRVETRAYGDDRASAEARVWELVALVEAALRTDLRLGNVLRVPLNFDEQEVETLPAADSWHGVATVPLVCQARI